MKLLWPQSYLSILLGATSALLGWHLSQLILLLGLPLTFYPVVLFASTSLTLCLGITAGEIFLNNPARPKLAWLRFRPSLLPVSLTALFWGLGAGLITLLILLPFWPIPATFLRIFSWALVGGATGHAEGQAWKAQSAEAGDKEYARTRINNSRAAGIAAGIAAGLLFELLRGFLRLSVTDSNVLEIFQALEEALGFALFGGILGYFLSCTSSPTYRAALRAGAGFEFTNFKLDSDYSNSESKKDSIDAYPRIRPQDFGPTLDNQTISGLENLVFTILPFLKPPTSSGMLKFVNRSGYEGDQFIARDGEEIDRIEEGLSIQLPSEGRIFIGNPLNSQAKTHIVLVGFSKNNAAYCAHLDVTPTAVTLTVAKKYRPFLRRNGIPLKTYQPIRLHHNDVLTFSNPDDQSKFYRFVYYNRFLDPQA